MHSAPAIVIQRVARLRLLPGHCEEWLPLGFLPGGERSDKATPRPLLARDCLAGILPLSRALDEPARNDYAGSVLLERVPAGSEIGVQNALRQT
jgi:hypothetical protein